MNCRDGNVSQRRRSGGTIALLPCDHRAMFLCVCVCNVCMYICLHYLILRKNLQYLGKILVA